MWWIFKHNLKNIIRFPAGKIRAWDLVESELSLKPRDIFVLLAAEGPSLLYWRAASDIWMKNIFPKAQNYGFGSGAVRE